MFLYESACKLDMISFKVLAKQKQSHSSKPLSVISVAASETETQDLIYIWYLNGYYLTDELTFW